MIPLFKPFIDKSCVKELTRVLSSGYIGEGKKVKELERLLSDYLEGYVVLTNSATSALHLAYHMSGVKDHEVVTTPMTCMATNTPILNVGGTVVWADVNPETGNIDPLSVLSKITKKTRAITCVHYGGNLCSPELLEISKKHKIPLIEDCAHLLNKGLGGLQAYSFQAIKFMTTGDGGALVTQDKKIYDRAKLLRWYGIDRESGQTMRCMNPVHEVGFKFHMNDIAATIGIANHNRMSEVYTKTQNNARFYNEEFTGLFHFKKVPVETRNDYWLYILKCDDRDNFMKYMKEQGIETSLVHARNDIQPIFKDSLVKFDGLEKFWTEQVCIPVGWWLSKNDVRKIAKAVKDYDTICSY